MFSPSNFGTTTKDKQDQQTVQWTLDTVAMHTTRNEIKFIEFINRNPTNNGPGRILQKIYVINATLSKPIRTHQNGSRCLTCMIHTR